MMSIWACISEKISPARYRRDERGTAAVEFALIFPVLLLAYLGCVSSYHMYRSQNTVTRASSTVVDLVTRLSVLSESSRDRVFAVADALVGDIGSENVEVVITSISNPVGNDDEYVVDWSYASGGGSVLDTDDVGDLDIPTIAEGESVILTHVSTDYSARFLHDTLPSVTLKYEAVRRPRFVLRIPSTIDE